MAPKKTRSRKALEERSISTEEMEAAQAASLLEEAMASFRKPATPQSIETAPTVGLSTVAEGTGHETTVVGIAAAPSGHCVSCGAAPAGQMLSALDAVWHVHCFVCSACSKPFDDGGFVEAGGKPMHEACALAEMGGSPCGVCGKPLEGSCVTVDGKQMHAACFTCTECGCVLDGTYGLLDGKPYCAFHLDVVGRARPRMLPSTMVPTCASNEPEE